MDICRGCMTATNYLLDIFSGQTMQYYEISLADMINELVSFKVQRGDKLPQKICVPCCLNAQIGFQFKHGFEQCHQLLCMKLNANCDSDHEQHGEESRSEMGNKESSDSRNLDAVQPNASIKTQKCVVRLRSIKLPTAKITKSDVKDLQQFLTVGNPQPQIVKSVSKRSRIRNFRCDLCSVSWATRQNLERHRKTHTEKRKYKCLHCTKAYRKQYKLLRHIGEHINNVSNMCRLCSKSFSYRSSLKRHYLVHTDMRPFVCPHCKISFKLSTSFKRHLYLHSDVRPYKCDSCDRNFISKWNLGIHSKSCNAKK